MRSDNVKPVEKHCCASRTVGNFVLRHQQKGKLNVALSTDHEFLGIFSDLCDVRI